MRIFIYLCFFGFFTPLVKCNGSREKLFYSVLLLLYQKTRPLPSTDVGAPNLLH